MLDSSFEIVPRTTVAVGTSTSTGNFPLEYYVENYSTASIAGTYTFDAGYDWIINVVETLPLPDTTELETVLNTAKSIQNDNYTDASWSNLQASIEYAETILASSVYTQVQVDGALGRLNNSMNSLVVKPVDPVVPPPVVPPNGEHRYLRDGIRIVDLLPAQEAILENIDFARGNGYKLFAVLFAVALIPKLLKTLFSFNSDSRFVDRNAGEAMQADFWDGEIEDLKNAPKSLQRKFGYYEKK